ncbi:ribonuclease P protein component [Propionicimonas paludicola]|uniref:Ribonuclease P protein component n=2 Tax=Propionicimonas paludicola TaxID=185243 RepID=A0A2A9CW02_9ACTN|nr:ribonuclease P protein component [Propionicimonas paludicola]
MHVRLNGRDDSRAGFIVSKAVGKAVTRNRVKRRLRHVAAAAFSATPSGVDVVVRALPSAVAGDLRDDFDTALRDCLGRLAS